jgi:splicing factor 3B subunit 3
MQLYLYAGLLNGMIVRTSIDTITGKLTDSRPKYLGLKPVKCIKLKIMGKPAILALSSRPWLMYTYGKKQMITLLAFPFITVAA